jgi:hypothetical protein
MRTPSRPVVLLAALGLLLSPAVTNLGSGASAAEPAPQATGPLPVLSPTVDPATTRSATGHMRFRPTGYFRVGLRQHQWWLVTPDGRPFYSSGVDHVSADPDTDQKTGRCPYCDAISSEYPNLAAWTTATVARLRSWGFNTIGSFSDYSRFSGQMPYTELLSMASGSDWFAPSFATNAFRVAATTVAPLAGDRNLIGWYTDSELHWGPDWRSPNLVLDDYLALPPGSPGRAVAERYRHHPDGFVRALATRYFSVTTAAIRSYDPNHLILGVKAPVQLIQPELLHVAHHYVDVFSVDDYALVPGLEQLIQHVAPQYINPTPDLSNIESVVRRPLIIGEYGFRAADSGLPNTWPPIFPVYATQNDRAAAYDSFIGTMYSAPWVVGDAWFEYVDEPPGGRTGDGENSNWGLVSVADAPYPTMVSAVSAMHAKTPASSS